MITEKFFYNLYKKVQHKEVRGLVCLFELFFWILSVVVTAPQLNTSSSSNDTIFVTWSPVKNAALYSLVIIMEGSSTRLKLNTTNTSMTFDQLQAGTTYCIKGTAWDSDGRSGDDLTVCQITRTNKTT